MLRSKTSNFQYTVRGGQRSDTYSSGGYLDTEICSGHQDFGERDRVVGQHDHFEQIADFRIVVLSRKDTIKLRLPNLDY